VCKKSKEKVESREKVESKGKVVSRKEKVVTRKEKAESRKEKVEDNKEVDKMKEEEEEEEDHKDHNLVALEFLEEDKADDTQEGMGNQREVDRGLKDMAWEHWWEESVQQDLFFERI